MTNRVAVNPDLLRWARERAGRSAESLAGKFPKLAAWEAGEARPTLKQLEGFARATHLPAGYLFLREPPEESVPIPDLRTPGKPAHRASESRSPGHDLPLPAPAGVVPRLGACGRRGAARLRRFGGARGSRGGDGGGDAARAGLRSRRPPRMPHVDRGPAAVHRPGQRARRARDGERGRRQQHRKIDPEEFRGFALADDLAPLVFVNGADTTAAQMFTLDHELTHLWLGESALTDVAPASTPLQRIE